MEATALSTAIFYLPDLNVRIVQGLWTPLNVKLDIFSR